MSAVVSALPLALAATGFAAQLPGDVGNAFGTAAFSGSMLIAVPVALVAGLVSFASPCVLPLVPGYLGYLGGMSGTLRREEPGATGAGASADGSGRTRRVRARLLLGVALFVAGFTAVFVSLGTLAGSLGSVLGRSEGPLSRVLGVVVIAMGLAFMGAIPFLQQDRRVHVRATTGLWGAPVLGVVFGLGWAPCIGPTLAAVIALSLDGGSAVRGAFLSVAYCVGLGLPFLLVALGLGRSARALAFLRAHRLALMRAGGGLLVVIGLALVTGLWGAWTQSLQGLVGGFAPVV